MASRSETRSYRAKPDLYHITVDTEGLFHHDCPGLDGGPFRSLAEVLAALKLGLKPGSRMLPGAEAYGKLFPLVGESLLPPAPWSGWKLKYHLTLKGGLFDVHPPDIGRLYDVHPADIGGPFQGLGEALAALERHRASLSTPAPAAEASSNPPHALAIAVERHGASLALAPASSNPPPALAAAVERHGASPAPAPAAEASSTRPPALAAAVERHGASPAPAPAAEASSNIPPALVAVVQRHRASLTMPPAPEAFLAPPPAAEASLAPPPAAEASLAPPPAADASLAPPPAAEASSNPPPADEEDWMKEQREKGRARKLYLSQLDPEEVLRSVKSTLIEMANDAQKETKPAEQPVEKSWMDTIIEKLTPTTTDPDILKARYRFERLVEKRETIKNGMKWMRKEVLRAFESYRSLAGYNKNFEYDFVRLDFQCLIYGTFSKSYHHYNFTMRTRLSRSKPWTYQRYFAEVKPTENETVYFCCPLQPSEDGHCFGCRKAGISLRHPDSGFYEKGHPGCGFPFDTDSESDD